jgi:hypothetical protein
MYDEANKDDHMACGVKIFFLFFSVGFLHCNQIFSCG